MTGAQEMSLAFSTCLALVLVLIFILAGWNR